MKRDTGNTGNPFKIRCLEALLGAAMLLVPICAHAQSVPSANGYAFSGSPFVSWLDMVSATQAAQPSWMTPLVTVTPRLEQEFRFDFYDQQNGTGSQGNGQHIFNYGGPGGPRVELIPAWPLEVILAAPPYETASGPKGDAQGWGDWPAFLVKYRLISANKDNGDYIVTAFFQMSDPLGTPGKISNNVLTAQPTIAFGKGFGDFDIQSTVSVQIPVGGLGSPGTTATTNMANFGDPILWNTTFQYHFLQYFWPELEVNYEHWPNGEHAGLDQVMLTPGIIFGRFKIGQDSATRPMNLIVGVGCQIAVTQNPVIHNNIVATTRLTF
ncbi:MAG: hypothetical protein AB1508_14805 [Pseudomonadota bacterium]